MAAVVADTPPLHSTSARYLPVQTEMLRHVKVAAVDIFVQADAKLPPTLYCREGLPLENGKLFSLSDAGIHDVYVRADDFQRFGENLLDAIDSRADRDQVEPAVRFAALQLAVAGEIEHAMRLVDCDRFVTLADKMSRDLTCVLAGNGVLPRELFRMARHDYHTFTHVTNVASYAVLLAEQLGLCPADELEQIAEGAILHDIGKRFIPARILTKPARLDPEERAIIETHPTRGYEELCDRPGLSRAQLMMVYQHHERVDGTGYPVGLTAGDIHPWAKMLAVVDVFDAITGKRPYRKPGTSQEALDYIRNNSGSHFDTEAAKCWISAMSKA